jgi:hypothetical protein
MNEQLIELAKSIWPFTNPPLALGVEDGVVWGCQRGTVGICGYALIPAEGHPWSPRFPNGIDQDKDSERSRKTMSEFMRLTEKEGLSFAEASERVYGGDTSIFDTDYMDNYLDIHGGVTYYCHPWVGFDTGHGCDIWTPEWDEHGLCSISRAWNRQGIHWTPEMVYEEAKNLARQVAAVGAGSKAIDLAAANLPE